MKIDMYFVKTAVLIILQILFPVDAVTLTGSSEYAVPGAEFTLTCDVPEEANQVQFKRRDDVDTLVGGIQVTGGQCKDNTASPVLCTADVCSCVTSGGNLGTVFRWIIQPQTGDQGSVWFCKRTNLKLPDFELKSDDYILNLADGPGTSIALSPPDTTYTRTEGDTLPDITCTADCRPDCTFVWTRPDNTNFTMSPVHVLSLGQLDRSENGTYRCTAKNVVGESPITLSVIVQYGPSTVSLTPPTVTYTPTEGQTIPTITCSADCNPACTFSWTKDGQSYRTGSGLQLTNIQRGRTGVYRCTASNVHGSDVSVNINVIVDYGPGTSVALSPPDTTYTYTRTEGDTLPDITCTADCRPDCTFVWTRPDNTNFTMSPVLSLGQLDRSEHGTYTCTARNNVGESPITLSVIVQYGPGTSIALSPANTTYTRTEGDTLPDITCTADCRPDCTFVWTRPDNTNFSVSPVLSLGQLDRSEHGTYRCTTRNVVGELSIANEVNVQYGPGNSVVLFPQDTTYTRKEGDTLPDINCTADCRPGCTFMWTRPDNTNFTVSSVLSLGQLDRSEQGTYRCTAMNNFEESTISMRVAIQYGPGTSIALSPPDTTYTRTEGDTLPDITCTADCRPDCTFVWTRPDNTNFSVSPVLSLGQLDRSEHGTYRCTAGNEFGESTIATNVTVQYPATIKNIAFTTGNGSLTEGNSTSIVCTVDSFPSSTIQWVYNANGSVLLESSDVLESTYTLTNASCLDTGLYTCSVRNRVSTTAITRDISINVLCIPRADPRITIDYIFGLAIPERLTLTAQFLANPKPTFHWTFRNTSSVNESNLVNGTDNFETYSTYVETNFSAVSIGIRSSIQEHWYGTYDATATNSQGSGKIRFTVNAQGKPNSPYEESAVCPYQTKAFVSWRSPFDGGSPQKFLIGQRTQSERSYTIDAASDTSDPGQHQPVNKMISGLAPGTKHFFIVYAVNTFGNSTIENEINCTTKALPSPKTSQLGPILGAASGSVAVVIVCVVVVVIVITRRIRSRKNKKDDDTEMITGERSASESSDGLKPNILYESSDGLKANVLYETSGPQPGNSSEYAVVQKKSKPKSASQNDVYAVVDKSNKDNHETKNDVYAEVVKRNGKGKNGGKSVKGVKAGKGGKAQHNKGETKRKADDVYENVENVREASGDVYPNPQEGATPVTNNVPSRRKNKDGLIYLDIEFTNRQIERNYVIHGIENRTNYADVDFTKRADPLPSDDEDSTQTGDVGSANKNNT